MHCEGWVEGVQREGGKGGGVWWKDRDGGAMG